jgi:hypothetical protein
MAMWADWLRVSALGLVALWLVLGGAQGHAAELLTFEVGGRQILDVPYTPVHD